jgi:hypothetical protein
MLSQCFCNSLNKDAFSLIIWWNSMWFTIYLILSDSFKELALLFVNP